MLKCAASHELICQSYIKPTSLTLVCVFCFAFLDHGSNIKMFLFFQGYDCFRR